MRVLPSGTTALLVELDDLAQVRALHEALSAAPPAGVVDLVPAARTVLVVCDPGRTTLAALEDAVRRAPLQPGRPASGELVEVPVVYDGEDLTATAAALGCSQGTVKSQTSRALDSLRSMFDGLPIGELEILNEGTSSW